MRKVAVVGAGTMGTVHAQAYHAMKQAELVGIVDIRLQAARELAERTQTNAFESLDALLREVDVDVIDICVPTYLHRRYTEQAAAAGKHVVCEKPMARSLADARAMMDACEAANVKLFIAHVVRFFPEYRRAFEMVQDGCVGRVGTVRTSRGGSFPTAWNDWYASEQNSGTVIVDAMIHDFDFLRWTLGDVDRVYAKSLSGRESNRMDHAFVSLHFESGVIGHAEGTWAYPDGFRTELEIAGDDGLIQHQSDMATPVHTWMRQTAGPSSGVTVPESGLDKSPYQLELEHFMDCLIQGTEPVITATDAYKALEIALAALESVKTGQVIQLNGGERR